MCILNPRKQIRAMSYQRSTQIASTRYISEIGVFVDKTGTIHCSEQMASTKRRITRIFEQRRVVPYVVSRI